MDVWEMAQRCVQLAGPRATPNRGLKPPAYTELRNELVSCCGTAWARELIREAFAARYVSGGRYTANVPEGVNAGSGK
jgi:hypothetical protein